MSITRQQALDFFRSDDLIGLGMEADAIRRKLHPEGVATYSLDREIGYRAPREFEHIHSEVAEAMETGSTGIVLTGGLDSDSDLGWFKRLIGGIRRQFPQLNLQCLNATEVIALAERGKLSLTDVIAQLHNAGLDSLLGDGGWPSRLEDWLLVHRTAHQLGMRTAAVMIFGDGESLDQRMDFLEKVRSLQEETGGFSAFMPVSFLPDTALGGRELDAPTAVEHLKMLAISRLYLSNIENIQASTVAQGPKVLQLALRFGGNDAGAVRGRKAANGAIEEDLRRIIRDAGFKPVRRDSLYRAMFLN
jgi:cyclic dehypoxanthinyl futalosine synthase